MNVTVTNAAPAWTVTVVVIRPSTAITRTD